MTDTLTIALAQFNPHLGDLDGNVARILSLRAQAWAHAADLVVLPELCVTGYPPEDLVLKRSFVDAAMAAVQTLAQATADGGPALLVGSPWHEDGHTHNTALLLDGGSITARRHKRDLPNYLPFDEKRVFTAGPPAGPVNFRGVRLGVMVCEDMWTPDTAETLLESGAEILVVPNGSPFDEEKADARLEHAARRVRETGLPLIYVNQLGGQDELVFDGGSFVLGADGGSRAQLPWFQPCLAVTHWTRPAAGPWQALCTTNAPRPGREEALYQAMALGLRDYVGKNGFPGVVLGMSGGIDSALSAAVAVDALGADRVHLVMMPSPYTSRDSLDDAREAAELLGCRLDGIPIEPAVSAYAKMLAPAFAGTTPDATEENLQSRARGMVLMALSNKFGGMVLTTGNKSEMAVGYATLYGDMCGGYSVLKDLYKTDVYAVSRWRNAALPDGAKGPAGRVIPERILTKAPTAELRPNQTDQDSLPPYDVLDAILRALVEQDMGVEEAVAAGHDRATVAKVQGLLDRAEYKRRQAPPGVRLSTRSFGRDRRYPLTQRFNGGLPRS